ncbi:YdeI/OmpD-associated family protein [Pedobacter sp. AW1-32]|uniref:YdeI/OmpD-associated family protein n=1 Tax=Pedobacter sp. AW1-32 TaxID=3383026 RepID=UPI003FEE4DEA
MVHFKSEIEKFDKMGEKTGWSYIFLPAALAQQIKKDCKSSFRIRGKIDQLEISGMAVMPMGEGNFILALKSEVRKKLKKEAGSKVTLSLEEDVDFKVEMPEDLEICLSEETRLMENFMRLPKSHRNYYINWINQAKTEVTRTKRITQTLTAMDKQQTYGEMIRSHKSEN